MSDSRSGLEHDTVVSKPDYKCSFQTIFNELCQVSTRAAHLRHNRMAL